MKKELEPLELTEMPIEYGCVSLMINNGSGRIVINQGHPESKSYKDKLRRIIKDAKRILNES